MKNLKISRKKKNFIYFNNEFTKMKYSFWGKFRIK